MSLSLKERCNLKFKNSTKIKLKSHFPKRNRVVQAETANNFHLNGDQILHYPFINLSKSPIPIEKQKKNSLQGMLNSLKRY